MREDEGGHRAEQEVVVPLDRGADGTRHHRPHHLFAPFLGRKGRHSSRTDGIRHISTPPTVENRSEEHTSELQSRPHLVCRLLLEKKKNTLPKPDDAVTLQ